MKTNFKLSFGNLATLGLFLLLLTGSVAVAQPGGGPGGGGGPADPPRDTPGLSPVVLAGLGGAGVYAYQYLKTRYGK